MNDPNPRAIAERAAQARFALARLTGGERSALLHEIDAAKEAVRLGAYDYIAKPVAPDDVLKAANDAITQKHWALRSEQPHSH